MLHIILASIIYIWMEHLKWQDFPKEKNDIIIDRQNELIVISFLHTFILLT